MEVNSKTWKQYIFHTCLVICILFIGYSNAVAECMCKSCSLPNTDIILQLFGITKCNLDVVVDRAFLDRSMDQTRY